MLSIARFRKTSGQANREILLVIIVCAVALIAVLSVYVPGLRHFWTGLGRLLFG